MVLGNIIIIISVKDVKVSVHQDKNVKCNRWLKNAFDNSLKRDGLLSTRRFYKQLSFMRELEKKL